MLDMAPQSFPAARYRFEWRVTRALRLPDYAGSTLRGAFGHALRKVACMTEQKGIETVRFLPIDRNQSLSV